MFRTKEEALDFGAARGALALIGWIISLSDRRPWPPWSKDANEAAHISMCVVDEAIGRAVEHDLSALELRFGLLGGGDRYDMGGALLAKRTEIRRAIEEAEEVLRVLAPMRSWRP